MSECEKAFVSHYCKMHGTERKYVIKAIHRDGHFIRDRFRTFMDGWNSAMDIIKQEKRPRLTVNQLMESMSRGRTYIQALKAGMIADGIKWPGNRVTMDKVLEWLGKHPDFKTSGFGRSAKKSNGSKKSVAPIKVDPNHKCSDHPINGYGKCSVCGTQRIKL